MQNAPNGKLFGAILTVGFSFLWCGRTASRRADEQQRQANVDDAGERKHRAQHDADDPQGLILL